MIRLLLLKCCLLLTVIAMAKTIVVKNVEELNAANNSAQPGDTIILRNGEWKDAVIKLTCNGTAAKRITFKAQTSGRLLFTGRSRVAIGGSYITIDGWHFRNGSAGTEDVISFRTAKTQAATYCRVTNCSIYEYSDGKRLDENYWVAFYGNHNRLDHSTFLRKLNMGVLLAVMLEEKSWRENYHSIDSNYFGMRPPLGSNGGEIIRVGVSQTSMYNSNTNIHHNFFYACDGEAEIISIKSGGNFIRDNLFQESQGAVVLRHGNNNTVEHNIFWGRQKAQTGGVRVINEGQWVVNNLFVDCMGSGFRSPMAIMNGVPNSPVNRYLPVKNAVISNNTFIGCASLGFGDGSDAERSAAPKNVHFINNQLLDYKDSAAIRFYEPTTGNFFKNNEIDQNYSRTHIKAIEKQKTKKDLPGSLAKQASKRLLYGWPSTVGATEDPLLMSEISGKYLVFAGCDRAAWNEDPNRIIESSAKCETVEDIKKALAKKTAHIELTASAYHFKEGLLLNYLVSFSQKDGRAVLFSSESGIPAIFIMGSNGSLSLSSMILDLSGVRAANFILADTTGSVHRFRFSTRECYFLNLNKDKGCTALFRCPKSSYADYINITGSYFININSDLFLLNSETDNKGLYNAEQIEFSGNYFENISGTLIDLYRGGNDESTLGLQLIFNYNNINNSQNSKGPLLNLQGAQLSSITSNDFLYSNSSQILIRYKDTTRSNHVLSRNTFLDCGIIEKDQFVRDTDNLVLKP